MPLKGIRPRLRDGSWVAPNASVIGDVTLGVNRSVAMLCSDSACSMLDYADVAMLRTPLVRALAIAVVLSERSSIALVFHMHTAPLTARAHVYCLCHCVEAHCSLLFILGCFGGRMP